MKVFARHRFVDWLLVARTFVLEPNLHADDHRYMHMSTEATCGRSARGTGLALCNWSARQFIDDCSATGAGSGICCDAHLRCLTSLLSPPCARARARLVFAKAAVIMDL